MNQFRTLVSKSNSSLLCNQLYCNELITYNGLVLPDDLDIAGQLRVNDIVPYSGDLIAMNTIMEIDSSGLVTVNGDLNVSGAIDGGVIGFIDVDVSGDLKTNNIIPHSGDLIEVNTILDIDSGNGLVSIIGDLNVSGAIDGGVIGFIDVDVSGDLKTNNIIPHSGDLITVNTILTIDDNTNVIDCVGAAINCNVINPHSANTVTIATDLSVNNSTHIVDISGVGAALQCNTHNVHSGDTLSLNAAELVIDKSTHVSDYSGSITCNTLNPHSANTVTIATDLSVNNSTHIVDISGVGAALQCNTLNAHSGGIVSINTLLTINDNINEVEVSGALKTNDIFPRTGTVINLDSELHTNTGIVDVFNTLQANTLNPHSGNSVEVNTILTVNNNTNIIDCVGAALQCNTLNVHSGNTLSLNATELVIDKSTHVSDYSGSITCNTLSPHSGSANTVNTAVITNNGVGGTNIGLTGTNRLTLLTTGIIIDGVGGTIVMNPPTALGSTLSLDDTLTIPSNVTSGVIQMKNKSDATYGNPTSSALLYVDSDNVLKTKNSSGSVVALGQMPYFDVHTTGNYSLVITTANTYTKLQDTWDSQTLNQFTVSGSSLTYTGTATMLFDLTATIKCNTASAVGDRIQALMYKNATFNGSSELTGGTQLHGSYAAMFTTLATQQITLTLHTIVSLATNDVLSIVVNCRDTTSDLSTDRDSFTAVAISAGTD